MKASCKSLDVFEFRDEDELAEVTARNIATKFRKLRALDRDCSFLDPVNRGAKIHSKETGSAMNENVDVADIDQNCDIAGSLNPMEIENLSNGKMSGSNTDLHNEFETHKQAAEIESKIPVSGNVFPVTDELVRLVSDADESKTSSEGPSSDNCFSGWDLGDNRMGVVFYTDYVYYCGIHYPNTVVNFSRSFVEIKSRTTYGTEESFHSQLEIDDIVKIESQWSARHETGSISIFFITRSVTHDQAVCNGSGCHELKFPLVDSAWYEKKEAIESLHMKYKSRWSALLDIGLENCSASSNQECLMFTRSYFPNFNKPFDEVIYPKGDPDAVSISKRDVDLLQPDTFVNDTIIDFYIKFLKNRLNVEERLKFHFFNSFFFRKLADMDKDPSSAFDGNAAFQRVRKWTRKVNLLEKDFIFIPVNYNYHWSLIVICYFGEVARSTDTDDKLVRVPCILHMDSIRGNHMGIKDLMQSYLWEEWKERQKETEEDLYSKFRNLKFVSLELPQQQNLYDCGLFLLHYVELFLEEVPTNFNVYKITPSFKFLQADWFPSGEASMKRAHIERLIYELLEAYSEECSSSSESDPDCSLSVPTTANYDENANGIEMTLVPATCRSDIQCTANSGLSLKTLFEAGYPSGSSNDSYPQAFERGASIDELSRPVPPAKEEVEVGEHFVHTGLAEPSLQHVDGLIQGKTVFPNSSRDFAIEPDEAMLEDADSSPATSGSDTDDISEVEAYEKCQYFATVGADELVKPKCILSECIELPTACFTSVSRELVHVPESCNFVGTSNQNVGSLLLKNLPGFCEGMNQTRGSGTSCHGVLPSCPPLAPGDTDAIESGSRYQIVNSADRTYQPIVEPQHLTISLVGVDGVSQSEACNIPAAKRMRTSHPHQAEELTCDLSKDLHL